MNNQKPELQTKEDAPKTVQGAQGVTSPWKRLLAKKWVFPATYIAAAAIILTFMWVYQDVGRKAISEEDLGLKVTDGAVASPAPDALAVQAQPETMQRPFEDHTEVLVSLPFYDSNATNEVRQAAMIEYGDTLTPHVGVDFKKNDGEAFDVLAALSGKVTAVEQNPVVGYLVEITHSNGLVTVYQSLSDVTVAKDAEVKQGDIIAKAGRNELEKGEGVHLHFEVRQGIDGAAINPETLLGEL
ncbi:M23 family metallopeptidase [Paenibacillus eucommiae]|uniref:Stage II sporulation protein Q n=1 Tax=Paenibacillus eucommiae TaxID=1355755 RepID=A0ABS4IYF5_9BACL|nr:M23 family metallopeptidase [Paenibacillus eucommiae]MBP1992612.1 stage II sporulation protein Q [Paenibacillus eucommiae]